MALVERERIGPKVSSKTMSVVTYSLKCTRPKDSAKTCQPAFTS